LRRVYTAFGILLLLGYTWAEATGWEVSPGAKRSVVPASARTAGGFRSYHFWSGGK